MTQPQKKTTKEPRPRGDTLASSIVLLLAVNIVQRSIGFGRGVLFCRWLDPEQLGLWEMAYTFLLLAAPVAVLGLPGSFGRYLVRYQEAGHLGVFLRRTGVWTLGLAAGACAVLLFGRQAFARLIFGDPGHATLVVLVAGCLLAVILHHFLQAVLAGLKQFRAVSSMHFCQSVVFAATAMTLIGCWHTGAASIVIGYAVGCAVSSAGVILWSWLRRDQAVGHGSAPSPPHREFWPPLMRFAIGVWVADLLSNLFGVIDRYMILHGGAFDPETAIEQIGNYHTSCVVPVLMISVANLLVGVITPHLSHDWESGDRRRVSDRLNQMMQLVAVGGLLAGAAVLLFCPWLFRIAFAEKYAAGLSVLPWTVLCFAWFSQLLIAQIYAWCAERTRAAAWPLAIGLVTNVGLNLLWLPRWGLAGAVAATAAATLLALLSQLVVNQRLGMTPQPATLLLCFCPIILVCGVTITVAGAIGIGATAACVYLASHTNHRALAAPTGS